MSCKFLIIRHRFQNFWRVVVSVEVSNFNCHFVSRKENRVCSEVNYFFGDQLTCPPFLKAGEIFYNS